MVEIDIQGQDVTHTEQDEMGARAVIIPLGRPRSSGAVNFVEQVLYASGDGHLQPSFVVII
jgi:hypothetical protein